MPGDSFRTGLIAGLLAPVIGFFAYAAMYVNVIRPEHDLHWFIFELFLRNIKYQSSVLSLSLIADAFLFFWFDRTQRLKSMRGTIAAMMIYGVVIVLLFVIDWSKEHGWFS